MKSIKWEPKTEAEWLALLLLLTLVTDAVRAAIGYSDDDKATIIKMYNMAKELMDNVVLIDQSKSDIMGYKNSFWEGPPTTSMTEVPIAPVYETGAAISPAGVKTFVRELRLQVLPNCTPAQARALDFTKGEDPFVPADSIAKGKADASIGNIAVTAGVKDVGMHNLYARVTGTSYWIFIRTFSGAHYDYHRVPTTPNTTESVDMMLMGVIDNVEIGHPSPTFTVLYQPQQTPPPAV